MSLVPLMALRHSDSAHSSPPSSTPPPPSPPPPPPPSIPPPPPPLLLASVCRYHQSVEDVTVEAARRPLSYSNASPHRHHHHPHPHPDPDPYPDTRSLQCLQDKIHELEQ